MADNIGNFNEMNPVAQAMMDHPYAIIVFKLGTVAFASVVLLAFRRHPLAELGCWGLAAVYALLSVIWLQYFLRTGGHH
jgi:hypothetical protein